MQGLNKIVEVFPEHKWHIESCFHFGIYLQNQQEGICMDNDPNSAFLETWERAPWLGFYLRT